MILSKKEKEKEKNLWWNGCPERVGTSQGSIILQFLLFETDVEWAGNFAKQDILWKMLGSPREIIRTCGRMADLVLPSSTNQ